MIYNAVSIRASSTRSNGEVLRLTAKKKHAEEYTKRESNRARDMWEAVHGCPPTIAPHLLLSLVATYPLVRTSPYPPHQAVDLRKLEEP